MIVHFHIGWPQAILLTLYAAVDLYAISHHGKPREGTTNGIVAVLSNIPLLALLWWGGFFG